jgi:hypothetical protein
MNYFKKGYKKKFLSDTQYDLKSNLFFPIINILKNIFNSLQ